MCHLLTSTEMSIYEQFLHPDLYHLSTWYSSDTQAKPYMDPSECSYLDGIGANAKTDG